MRKLILRCGLPPGDIVMLTAAVRDLHRCHPGRFVTDVRTFYPEIWENNPYLTALSDEDPEVEQIECSYPLINHSNGTAHHCLQGFIQFLNAHLQLSIHLTRVKGDIHLSALEKSWYSQVFELTGQNTPFWIVSAGGKYDVTIKWWDTARFQEVVDAFRGKIQFVQVGKMGHHHPKLDGVIDLRGKTDLRQLIRLVYHAQGVLCPITSLMHLAAAVETKRVRGLHRPCVVVAGGREPAHWESYPGHQFMHANQALACCPKGGCWKNRTARLRDGTKRDREESLCVDVVAGLPRCMDMIKAADVVRRIELYYDGGLLRYLSPRQTKAAREGVLKSEGNPYDQQPLNIHSAGMACDRFVSSIPPYPGSYHGRGIVICGGGLKYFTNAWVCINMLRRHGCNLPVQVWHLGKREMDKAMEELLGLVGAECIDGQRVRKRFPFRILNGWELKAYSLLHCPFREVLLLDADNVPVVNPEFLFDTPQFRATGAIFWPDYHNGKNKKATLAWRSCGLVQPSGPEFESGQIVLDKERCWRALQLSGWLNENSDFYYRYVHGDKETFHLAFRKVAKKYALVPKPIHPLKRTMCQHDFEGRRIFQHRNGDKWDLLLCNQRIPDFWFEKECLEYVRQLGEKWDGWLSRAVNGNRCRLLPRKVNGAGLSIIAVMISCVERDPVRQQTLKNLAATDWGDLPLQIQMDRSDAEDHVQRQTDNALEALRRALDTRADYLLFLEDDLEFNRYIRHNLEHWLPLRRGEIVLGGLYNPRLQEIGCDVKNRSRIVSTQVVYGSQALIISRPGVKHIIEHWNEARGMGDIRIPRLVGRKGAHAVYHAPSLVQHVGRKSIIGVGFHRAADFDPDWKAGEVGRELNIESRTFVGPGRSRERVANLRAKDRVEGRIKSEWNAGCGTRPSALT